MLQSYKKLPILAKFLAIFMKKIGSPVNACNNFQKLSFSHLISPLSLNIAARPINTGGRLREG
jgi:hypothetical protein